jgi:hypothetical protein
MRLYKWELAANRKNMQIAHTAMGNIIKAMEPLIPELQIPTLISSNQS